MRELKLVSQEAERVKLSRTPPGVRELKLEGRRAVVYAVSRTPPGVRELKRLCELEYLPRRWQVAPLPGCVN